MEDKTKEDLDADGWFHTGDIGVFEDVGKDGMALRIIDRKKNIFKLAQGEYVAAEKIEATYGKDPLVDQVWVYGNSFESSLVGVVVPNPDQLTALAAKVGVSGDRAALCKDPKVRDIPYGKTIAHACRVRLFVS
jgi:long-chain acyl-CoA synthetase